VGRLQYFGQEKNVLKGESIAPNFLFANHLSNILGLARELKID
jgi:hypothetical protein